MSERVQLEISKQHSLKMLNIADMLMKMHHEWSRLNEHREFAHMVEWLLERTTCIQRELFKWMYTHPENMSTILAYSFQHVNDEVKLLQKDLDIILKEAVPRTLRR